MKVPNILIAISNGTQGNSMVHLYNPHIECKFRHFNKKETNEVQKIGIKKWLKNLKLEQYN